MTEYHCLASRGRLTDQNIRPKARVRGAVVWKPAAIETAGADGVKGNSIFSTDGTPFPRSGLDSRPGFPGLLRAGMTSVRVTCLRGNETTAAAPRLACGLTLGERNSN